MRVLALALSMVTAAAAAQGDTAALRLLAWSAAVDEHRAGETDAALGRIVSWSYHDIETMIGAIAVLVGGPGAGPRPDRPTMTAIRELQRKLQARGDFDTFRKRAAILHTDAALAYAPIVVDRPSMSNPHTPQPSRRVDVVSFDGKVERYELANPHWDYARLLLASLPAEPRRDPIVAQWYSAVGAHFLVNRAFAEAMEHYRRARGIVPDDPDVLYGEAWLQETLGAPRIQDYVRITTLENSATIVGVSSPSAHYRRAEELLTKAVAARPGFVEANLRLGHVLIRQHKYVDALPYLRRAVSDSRDAALTYYAHLFIGDAAFALDDREQAAQAYDVAAKLFPRSQAPYLGLGLVHRVNGERDQAASAVLAATAGDKDEPWFDYYDGNEGDADRLLDELRAPFKEPR